jgi:DNA invertase Pin-like site-specific DNA recombinase
MKTAVYVRVSTVGQNEAGQRREIGRWLAGNKVEDATWYVDKKSGDNLERPEFKRLQQAIFMGEHDAVVVYKLDRLSRTIQGGLNTLCDWCDKGLRVVAVTQQIDVNNTVGKIIAAVLLGIAQMEQENRKERQAAGIEAAKARGIYRGRKPGTTKARPQRAKQLREQGLTMDEIAASLGVTRPTAYRYINSVQSV